MVADDGCSFCHAGKRMLGLAFRLNSEKQRVNGGSIFFRHAGNWMLASSIV